MSDILSQAEIEALLSSLGNDTPPPAPVGPGSGGRSGSPSAVPGGFLPATRLGARSTIAYEIYDFRRPDKFSKDQLRTLQMLHETFARMAGSSLSAYLRTSINIELISLEQVPYEEYLRSINQSVFTIMSLPPLSGQAVLEIEFSLVLAMVDRLLGGPGKPISRSVLTEIERPLLQQIVERLFLALKNAWEGLVIVNPGVEATETSAQFVQIAPPNDIVVTILFEVKVGSVRSAMSLCIPYVVLKPITNKLSAQKWFAGNNRKPSPTNRRMLTHQVRQSRVPCTVRLGKSRILMRDFMDLRPGDILKLDQQTTKELTFLIGNVAKFHGRPAVDGKKIVFAVTRPTNL